jgi:hypothetical protein
MQRWRGAICAFMVAGTIATTASADDATFVERQRRPHRPLFYTGAVIFGTTYAVTASLAGASQRAGDRDLFIPGAGPFVNLANRNCARGCVTTTSDVALIMTSGILQNIGAGLMVLSAFVPQSVPEARADRRPNRTLLWTGVTVFAVTYAGSVAGGTIAGDRVPDKNLFIPLVGPWLDLGQRNCDFRDCDDSQEGRWKLLIIGSGIAQGAGALLALSAFFVPETHKPEIHFAPVSYAGGGGIGAAGRF